MFEHSVFAKANSADQNMSEYLVSMIDNEKAEAVPVSDEMTKTPDACKSWDYSSSPCKGLNES
jgi:hypothetical protein